MAQLQFYNAKDLKINFKNPKAQGNYGSVFFGELRDGNHKHRSQPFYCTFGVCIVHAIWFEVTAGFAVFPGATKGQKQLITRDTGTQVVVKCPVLEEFSLKLFDTEVS